MPLGVIFTPGEAAGAWEAMAGKRIATRRAVAEVEVRKAMAVWATLATVAGEEEEPCFLVPLVFTKGEVPVDCIAAAPEATPVRVARLPAVQEAGAVVAAAAISVMVTMAAVAVMEEEVVVEVVP